MWLTTAQVARILGVTTRWVRWLARHGELPHQKTDADSGQRLFRRTDVQRVLIVRQEAKARSRASRLKGLRIVMLKAGFEPRQMKLPGALARPKLWLVKAPRGQWVVPRTSESALPHTEVKRPRSFDDLRGSKKLDYVNRKVGRGH